MGQGRGWALRQEVWEGNGLPRGLPPSSLLPGRVLLSQAQILIGKAGVLKQGSAHETSGCLDACS